MMHLGINLENAVMNCAGGDFHVKLFRAILEADKNNRHIVRKVYPHHVDMVGVLEDADCPLKPDKSVYYAKIQYLVCGGKDPDSKELGLPAPDVEYLPPTFYTFKFGAFKGQYIGDVSASYVLWVVDTMEAEDGSWLASQKDIVREYVSVNRKILTERKVREDAEREEKD